MRAGGMLRAEPPRRVHRPACGKAGRCTQSCRRPMGRASWPTYRVTPTGRRWDTLSPKMATVLFLPDRHDWHRMICARSRNAPALACGTHAIRRWVGGKIGRQGLVKGECGQRVRTRADRPAPGPCGAPWSGSGPTRRPRQSRRPRASRRCPATPTGRLTRPVQTPFQP